MLLVLQAAVLPDTEFPGLPTASPDHTAEAPKWPIQRARDRKPLPASSGWDTPATSPHIPAVRRDATGTDHNYAGWDAQGGNDWGGAEARGKWSDSSTVEEQYGGGWGGEQTNRYHESAHEEGARGISTAAHTQGMLQCCVTT